MPSRSLEVATQVTGLFPIGIPFIVFENMTGVKLPDNSGSAKYIKLSAGLTGSGEFNEGLLTNESVSGSAPLVEAMAEIATGPLAGQVVHLINTEEAFLRARETSGVLQMDQMQVIEGSLIYVSTNSGGQYSLLKMKPALLQQEMKCPRLVMFDLMERVAQIIGVNLNLIQQTHPMHELAMIIARKMSLPPLTCV